ncbi:nucleotide-binding protein [candidate division KSB1 bacterium]|nr:nucleotide-binding protein [candidate division KSB1 bacterium]
MKKPISKIRRASKRSTTKTKTNKRDPEENRSRAYVRQTDIPGFSLEDAVRVPRAIADNFGKDATKPLRVAEAMELEPGGLLFRRMTGAAVAYGLTDGAYNASTISLTPLGRRVVAPTEEGDERAALREACLKPRVIREFLTKYNNSKFPQDTIAKNVLEEMGVGSDATARTFELLKKSADFVGFFRRVKDSTYVDLDNTAVQFPDPPPETAMIAEDDVQSDVRQLADASTRPPQKGEPQAGARRAIFIAHGKNKRPLEQLEGILKQYGIPYKIAIREANAGRPISQKVADVMNECGAAILIFTADEELTDKDGKPLWRPSENVVFELGASSFLYDRKIIVFKEDKVSLATNYSDIGYITFEQDRLTDKTNELFRELIAFKLISITVGN